MGNHWKVDVRLRKEKCQKWRRWKWPVIYSSRVCRRLRSQSKPWLWRQV